MIIGTFKFFARFVFYFLFICTGWVFLRAQRPMPIFSYMLCYISNHFARNGFITNFGMWGRPTDLINCASFLGNIILRN